MSAVINRLFSEPSDHRIGSFHRRLQSPEENALGLCLRTSVDSSSFLRYCRNRGGKYLCNQYFRTEHVYGLPKIDQNRLTHVEVIAGHSRRIFETHCARVCLDFLTRGMVAILGGRVANQTHFANVPLYAYVHYILHC